MAARCSSCLTSFGNVDPHLGPSRLNPWLPDGDFVQAVRPCVAMVS